MPSIIVRAETSQEPEGAVLLRERVSPSDLESEHFSAQLLERVGWAVVDADEAEQTRLSRAARAG